MDFAIKELHFNREYFTPSKARYFIIKHKLNRSNTRVQFLENNKFKYVVCNDKFKRYEKRQYFKGIEMIVGWGRIKDPKHAMRIRTYGKYIIEF